VDIVAGDPDVEEALVAAATADADSIWYWPLLPRMRIVCWLPMFDRFEMIPPPPVVVVPVAEVGVPVVVVAVIGELVTGVRLITELLLLTNWFG
jgi:hypothetical protein